MEPGLEASLWRHTAHAAAADADAAAAHSTLPAYSGWEQSSGDELKLHWNSGSGGSEAPQQQPLWCRVTRRGFEGYWLCQFHRRCSGMPCLYVGMCIRARRKGGRGRGKGRAGWRLQTSNDGRGYAQHTHNDAPIRVQ